MAVDLTLGYTRRIIVNASAMDMLRNQLAYVLGTAKWETAHTMEPVREAYWLSEAWRKEHLDYYPWYGRGFVQLTWKSNYERAQAELGLDTLLTDTPDKALDPGIATSIILQGMMEGWFTGERLDKYVTLQKSDFVNARRVVNGTDKASEIASIAKDYDAALLARGYGVEEPSSPTPRLDALEAWAVSKGYVPPAGT